MKATLKEFASSKRTESAAREERAQTLKWTKHGNGWRANARNGRMAEVTEERGPLGIAFSVRIGARHIGSCGGGTRDDAFARAKQMASAALFAPER